MYPRLMLTPAGERRQQQGHPWVYDGEITRVMGEPGDGAIVDCYSTRNVFLGRGYFNSRSKIRLRVMTRHNDEAVDAALLQRRLISALARRQRLYPTASSLRLVHAEGDGLPGLTVDRYEDVLVMQCAALGLELQHDTIVRLLREVTGLDRLYIRNDLSVRRNDGLEPGKAFYAEPFPTSMRIREHGLTFEIDLATGHKTGFYLDQADNRLALHALVPAGSVVLDAFCYTGAFALHAVVAGASQAIGLDSSAEILQHAQRNAELNNVSDRCQFVAVNVFDHLRQLQKREQRFDVIILDPPSFTRHRHTVPQALSGYKEINLRALRLLRPGGVLLTFTCSYYVDRVGFEAMLLAAARDAKRQLIVRQRFSQALHHPEVMAIPETQYLKGLAVEVW